MEDVFVKLNVGLLWLKLHSTRRGFFNNTLDLKLRKRLVKLDIWSIALYGAETWTIRAVDQKHQERFETWCWRRMEMNWTDNVRN
jgi:hypothetical protein